MHMHEDSTQRGARVLRCLDYYYYLRDDARAGGRDRVFSSELARITGVSSSLVRRDLESIGVEGVPRIGTRSADVIAAVEGVFGLDRKCPAVLVGVGGLGRALLQCSCISASGVHIEALFDWDRRRVGTRRAARTVLPLERLGTYVTARSIVLGIINTHARMAQDVADTVVRAGVKAIWNFASIPLAVPPTVIVRNQSPDVGLAAILAALKSRRRALARSTRGSAGGAGLRRGDRGARRVRLVV